jgi:hypothetical protein
MFRTVLGQDGGAGKRRSRNRFVVVLLLALLPLGTSRAQRAELKAGAHVRLRAPRVTAGLVEGVILEVQRDTMTIVPVSGAPLPIAIASVTEAEVYRGKSTRAAAKTGALWGGLISLAIGVISAGFSDTAPGAKSSTGTRIGGAVAITVVGAGIGALVGGARGSEQWEKLTLP